MKEKALNILKIIASFLIGIWAVIWYGANKIGASIVLAIVVFVIMLPFKKQKWITIARIVFVTVAFIFVLYNISTTDLPPGTSITEIKFIDQIIHIFRGFIRHVTQ